MNALMAINFRTVGKPEVIDGPRGQVLVSRITGHLLSVYFADFRRGFCFAEIDRMVRFPFPPAGKGVLA
jgi:hypothetical protein